jgi:hypothetical protein
MKQNLGSALAGKTAWSRKRDMLLKVLVHDLMILKRSVETEQGPPFGFEGSLLLGVARKSFISIAMNCLARNNGLAPHLFGRSVAGIHRFSSRTAEFRRPPAPPMID